MLSPVAPISSTFGSCVQRASATLRNTETDCAHRHLRLADGDGGRGRTSLFERITTFA